MDFGMGLAVGMTAGFILWPWWAIAIFAIFCIVDIVCLENENAGMGSVIMLIGIALLMYFVGDINLFTWALENPGSVFQFGVGYIVIGLVWSMIKWFFFLLDVRDQMTVQRKEHEGVPPRPVSSYASRNKGRITSWICHWPLSIIATFFGQFLSRFVRWLIMDVFGGVYNGIGNLVFKDYENSKEDSR